MTNRPADQILDETFLGVRAKLLEVAATLDRIDRSADDGSPLSGMRPIAGERSMRQFVCCSAKALIGQKDFSCCFLEHTSPLGGKKCRSSPAPPWAG